MKKLVNRVNIKGRNLLLACVLGDADINKEGQVRFVHSWKQYEYIKWKFNLLRRNGIKVSNFFRYINTTGYKDYNIQYKFTANVTMFSKLLRKALYENHRVYFKRKHLNRLDPQGLAIWFMDDGSILRRKYKGKYCGFYLRISTYCSYEEANTIIKYFNEVWDIYPTKICEHTKKDTYTINFGAKEGKKLINIIKPFMCPSMMYKVLYNIEDLYTYYNIQDASEILALCTLESDRLEMEAHTTSIKK